MLNSAREICDLIKGTNFSELDREGFKELFSEAKPFFDALLEARMTADAKKAPILEILKALSESDYRTSDAGKAVRENVMEGYRAKAFFTDEGDAYVVPLANPSDHYDKLTVQGNDGTIQTKQVVRSGYCGIVNLPAPPKKTICHPIGRAMIYLGLLSPNWCEECIDPANKLYQKCFRAS